MNNFLVRLDRRLLAIDDAVNSHLACLLRTMWKKNSAREYYAKAKDYLEDKKLISHSPFKDYTTEMKLHVLMSNSELIESHNAAEHG